MQLVNDQQESARKNGVPVRRTHLDILRFVIETTCGPDACEAFLHDIWPRLRSNPKFNLEITEEEYQAAIEQVRKESPHFSQWLLKQRF